MFQSEEMRKCIESFGSLLYLSLNAVLGLRVLTSPFIQPAARLICKQNYLAQVFLGEIISHKPLLCTLSHIPREARCLT